MSFHIPRVPSATNLYCCTFANDQCFNYYCPCLH